MSRHRIKALSYREDNFEDDYDSADPDEQERLEECTTEVLEQLQTGEPSVTASREEVREALWHYYNDVQKSVGYLRGKKTKTVEKKQAISKTTTPRATAVPAHPMTPAFHTRSSDFSAAEFFCDSPWLNVPLHRKTDILIEPLYPRCRLLGGAPQSDGKMSKLAALAAARKKKEGEKKGLEKTKLSGPEDIASEAMSTTEPRNSTLTLLERLSVNGKDQRGSEKADSFSRKEAMSTSRGNRGKIVVQKQNEAVEKKVEEISKNKHDEAKTSKPVDLRASPSTFANIIIGSTTHVEPSHLSGRSFDVMHIYGQGLTEPFDFADSSPDDIVLKAQSSAKGHKSKQPALKQAGNKGTQADLASGMKSLAVEEFVKIKRKNLDVLTEFRKSQRKNAANFIVIGHVDAGKSTLMGRLLADLNAVDNRTIEKYRREAEKIGKGSFALAWVLDQGSEERARGVTIDIATNKFETQSTRFTILDAPGHRDFVPNMIAGASQADFAVLVIDASTGNFESGLKGQTKEHALLCRSMGVQKVVIAVNKMDTVQWSKDRFDEIEQQISSFLTAAGFLPKNISFVPCSGIRGDNVIRPSDDPNASWYSGHSLIEALETSEPFTHSLEKPLRLTIGDVFRGGTQNPLSISGRICAGSLQIGDQVLIMPSGEKAIVKNLEVDGEPNDWAVAGQNVVLNFTDIDPIHLHSGDVICTLTSPIQNTKTFTTKVLAFDHLMPMQVDIHRGRLHVPGRISRLVAVLDKGTGTVAKKKPKIIPPGTVARIIVEMEKPVPLEAPARIVLRAAGGTVAAGLLE